MLIVVTLIWGSTFVVTKDVLTVAPPLFYLASRFALGALVMGLWARRQPASAGARGAGPPGRPIHRDALVLGLLQGTGLLLQVLAQLYTTASKTAFLTALSVPLTPLCGLLLRGDRPRRAQIAAVLLGGAGVLLLTYPAPGPAPDPGQVSAGNGLGNIGVGELLGVTCAVIYGLAIVETAHRARHHADGASTFALATAQTVVCAAIFAALWLLLPAADALWGLPAALGALTLLWPPHLGPVLVIQIIYMAICCTALTFGAQTWAMGRMSAARAAVIFALEPVFTTVLAIAVFGSAEWPSARGAIGGLVVLLAVLLSLARPDPQRPGGGDRAHSPVHGSRADRTDR